MHRVLTVYQILFLKEIKRKKVILVEDVCRSHGASFKKKLGTFGLISNFSFYYAHMSTIEGGMICKTIKKYQMAKILNLMVWQEKNKKFESQMIKKYPKLSPQFIFLYPTFNFRNTEIGAVIGLNQLKRLNKNNSLRTRNFKLF